MIDIDRGAHVAVTPIYDINQDRNKNYLHVRIPLDGHMQPDWLASYQERARSKGITGHAEDQPDRTWLVIHVPGSAEPRQIRALLDDARALAADADSAAGADSAVDKPPVTGPERVIRDWWSRQAK